MCEFWPNMVYSPLQEMIVHDVQGWMVEQTFLQFGIKCFIVEIVVQLKCVGYNICLALIRNVSPSNISSVCP